MADSAGLYHRVKDNNLMLLLYLKNKTNKQNRSERVNAVLVINFVPLAVRKIRPLSVCFKLLFQREKKINKERRVANKIPQKLIETDGSTSAPVSQGLFKLP